MDVIERHNIHVSGVEDGQPMLFAHGFGCDQNMWRYVAPVSARLDAALTHRPSAAAVTDGVLAEVLAFQSGDARDDIVVVVVRVPDGPAPCPVATSAYNLILLAQQAHEDWFRYQHFARDAHDAEAHPRARLTSQLHG